MTLRIQLDAALAYTSVSIIHREGKRVSIATIGALAGHPHCLKFCESANKAERAEIEAWAKENGVTVR